MPPHPIDRLTACPLHLTDGRSVRLLTMKKISVADLLELPVTERLRLVELLWDNIAAVLALRSPQFSPRCRRRASHVGNLKASSRSPMANCSAGALGEGAGSAKAADTACSIDSSSCISSKLFGLLHLS